MRVSHIKAWLCIVVVVGAVATTLLRTDDTELPRPTSHGVAEPPLIGEEAKSDDKEYPKLPGNARYPPAWLLDRAPFDLESTFRIDGECRKAERLYLEVLTSFDPAVMAKCYPKEQREILQEQLGSQASRLIRFERRVWGSSDPFTTLESEAESVELDSLLVGFAEPLKKIQMAQSLPCCTFRTGITTFSLLPHMQASRRVARLLCLQIARSVDRGNLDSAINCVEIVLRLIRDLRHRAPTICHYVATAILRDVEKAVLDILSTKGHRPEDLDRLLKLIASHQHLDIDPFVTSVHLNYCMFQMMVYDIEHGTGGFSRDSLSQICLDNLTPISTPGQYFAWALGDNGPNDNGKQIDTHLQLMSAADFESEKKLIDDHFSRLLSLKNMPYAARIKAVDVQHSSVESYFIDLLREPWSVNVLALGKTTIGGLQCLVALRRWQVIHDGSPPNLVECFMDAGLEAVPNDPYSGIPFRSVKRGDELIIYSIGNDGRDDQAAVDWSRGRQPGDFIFRLATSAAE